MQRGSRRQRGLVTNRRIFFARYEASQFGSPYIESEHLVCEVEDTGIGICPDDQQFIFDEFFQVDELSSTKYRGAGLGLALVRDLLVLLEGDISLNSEVGKGTTVTFRLPIKS